MQSVPGGLSDLNDVKVLICHILSEVRKPLNLEVLADGMTRDGFVNYFDYAVAVADLLETGHIERIGDTLVLTKVGAQTDELLKTTLPLSVREHVYEGVLAANVSSFFPSCTTDKTESGYKVGMRLCREKGIELFSVSLTVGDEATARRLRENFLRRPGDIYLSLISLIK